MKVIDGDGDKSHWRFGPGNMEIWVCPICRAKGEGDKIWTIEVRPHRKLHKGGKKAQSPKIEACFHCLTQGRLTEV